MAKRYRPVARDQAFLLPPDMRDWLPAGHPVWLVIAVVDRHLDTSAVHALRRAGGPGAAGYDPDMLTALLVWAYANRVTSSRRIEGLCRTDTAFKVICGGGRAPDHVTVARFRAGLGEAAAALFGQVLMLCASLGMGRLGVVALDGMKIAASASKPANRTEAGLRKLAAELAAEHAAAGAAEDALFGPGVRGDELPPELADPRTRGERIAAALAGLEAGRHAAEAAARAGGQACLAKAAAGEPAGPPPPGLAVAAAEARLERARAAQRAVITARDQRDAAGRAAGHRGYKGRRPVPAEEHLSVRRAREGVEKARRRAAAAGRKAAAARGPGPVRNITDPQSRLMPARGGFIQGYNTQNMTSSDGLIIATMLTADPVDAPSFEPMLARAQAAAALIAAHHPAGPAGIGLVLADAGYLSQRNLTCPGPGRLIATGKRRDLARPAARHWRSPAVTAMAARLATSDGITAYKMRGHIAETPHGNIKHNLGFRQLSLRGNARATAGWHLAATVHNLLKAITTGHLTTTALASLS